MVRISIGAVVMLAVCAGRSVGSDWPQFRGPTGQGISDAASAPLTWSESENLVWKMHLPGRGWSSPVTADGKAWLTTCREKSMAPEEASAVSTVDRASDPRPEVIQSISLSLLEISLADGTIQRDIPLFLIETPDPIHGRNSFASPTPVLADRHCYCDFGALGVACVSVADGSVRWRHQSVIQHNVGPGSSPAVVDDLLILTRDGADAQYIEAIDCLTGNIVWKKSRPPLRATNEEHKKAFCTPLLIDVGGRRQLVIPGAQWFIAYEPESGDEIWRIDHGSGFSNVPRPVYNGEYVFLCTGFNSPELWAVDPTGTGDVTASHVAWKHRSQVPSTSSPIATRNRVFFVSDQGVATVLDATTGKQLARARLGGNYSASPLLADGKLYFANHEGQVSIYSADEDFEKLAVNQIEGPIMASPVPYGGGLLLRGGTHLYRTGR